MYLYWAIADEKPVGGYGDDGVNGLGDEWPQAFVKGLVLGVRATGSKQVWVCSKANDEPGTKRTDWQNAFDFIDKDDLSPVFPSLP